MHARQPAGRLLPDVELADLPQRVADHVLDEEPAAVARRVDARAVVLGGAEPGAVEQVAVDLDLAQRVVAGSSGFAAQRVLVQRGAAEVLEHQPQARAVRELDVELLEREAGPVGARAALQARDRHRRAPPVAERPLQLGAELGGPAPWLSLDAAHAPPTRSSRRVSTTVRVEVLPRPARARRRHGARSRRGSPRCRRPRRPRL